MPKTKALVIPDWVRAMKRDTKKADSLYVYLPSLMHWRNLDFMEVQLCTFTPNGLVRNQIKEVVIHIKELIAQKYGDTHPLVAKVSMSKHIVRQIIIEIAPDVPRPSTTGVMVLRLDVHGDISGVERQYQMNYRIN